MSQQNACTPRDFLRAVEHKFNVRFTFDIACTTQDCVVQIPRKLSAPTGYYFDEGDDALACDWSLIPVPQLAKDKEAAAWCNPPFKHVRPWAEKCRRGTGSYREDPDDNTFDIWTPGIRIFSLFPVGAGTQWFADCVLGQSDVYFIRPRLTFLDPRTGLPFVNKKTGKPQTGLSDVMLVDWAGEGEVYCWDWQETLQEKSREQNISLQNALNRV